MLLLFAIPLTFDPTAYDAFELPKITLFRILTVLVAFVWLILLVKRGEFSVPSSPLNWPIATFLGISIISTIFSRNPGVSLRGLYNFYFWGLTAIMGYILLYIIISTVLEDKDGEDMITAVLLGSVAVILYGFVQRQGMDILEWATSPRHRIWSTLGNPNFLGAYLVMVIPLAVSRFLNKNQKEEVRVILFLLIAALFAVLSFTLSRASWLAIIIGSFIWAVGLGRKMLKRKLAWMSALAVVVVFFGVLFVLPYRSPTGDQAVVERAASTLELNESSNRVRLAGWRTALRIVKRHPLLGTGLDTFKEAFLQYMGPDFESIAGKNIIPFYAHNEFLQVAGTTGLIGLAAYFWLWVAFIGEAWRACRQSRGEEKLFWSGLLGSGVALLIYNQFHFSVLSTSLLFWLYLGLLAGRRKTLSFRIPTIFSRGLVRVIGLVVFGSATLLLVIVSGRAYFADLHFKQGLAYFSSAWPERGLRFFRRAVELNPRVAQYRFSLAEAAKANALRATSIKEKEMYLKELVENYREAVRQNPGDPVCRHNLGIGLLWQTQITGENRVEEAVAELKEAVRLAPNLAEFSFSLGKAYAIKRDFARALPYYQRVVEIEPGNLSARHHLAEAFYNLGFLEKAAEEWQYILRIDPENAEAQRGLRLIKEQSEKIKIERRG
jgi:O-antigen ligase/Flp pilus assembly protein TadD